MVLSNVIEDQPLLAEILSRLLMGISRLEADEARNPPANRPAGRSGRTGELPLRDLFAGKRRHLQAQLALTVGATQIFE